MRVLVVATHAHFALGTRLMATVAAGLASRGEVVAMATSLRSETERAVASLWPRLALRGLSGAGWLRQAMSLRGVVTAWRPDAILVGSEHDAVLAAFAMGKGGAIVRRLAADERMRFTARGAAQGTSALPVAHAHAVLHDELPWRARFALSRASVMLWGERALAISWPVTVPEADAAVHRLPAPAPHPAPQLLLVPGATHDDRTAAALRGIAHLRTRHPDLQLTLIGETTALQATRLHAAALGMTACVHIWPVDALLHHELSHASAAWIAAAGDAGALATVAAMQQRIPVVIDQDADFAALVTPGATGIVVLPSTPGTAVAEVARLIGDAQARRRMGDAAETKASREHEWNDFVDEAASLLARAAGVGITKVTRRPSLTPA